MVIPLITQINRSAHLDLQRIKGRLDRRAQPVEHGQAGVAHRVLGPVAAAAHRGRRRGRGQVVVSVAHHRRRAEIPGTGRGARNDRRNLRVGEREGGGRRQRKGRTVREEVDHRVGRTHGQGARGTRTVRSRRHAHGRAQRHRHLQTVGAAHHVVLLLLLHRHLLLGCRRSIGWWRRRIVAHLLLIMHKVTPWTIRAVAGTVERAAQLGLVPGVSLQITQLMVAVRKLALVAVLALARLLKGPAQLGLVTVMEREENDFLD